MSSRRSLSKRKVLIDTTFLLPALGIEVEEEAMKIIPLFRKLEVYYLELGLMEALWKILKLVPLEKLPRVKQGLEAIRETYHLLIPSADAFIDAVEVYHRGHRDYIDALHYTTAKEAGMLFLTLDYDFIDFLKRHDYKVDEVMATPDDLKRSLKTAANKSMTW